MSVRHPAGCGDETFESAPVALRHGHHAAFARVVATYDEQLRALAYHMLGSREGMDDVLQDAYLAAYRSLNGFRGESSLGTWLYRITYTACLQRLRKAKSQDFLPLDEEGTALVAAVNSEEHITIRDGLRRALAQLTSEHRCAVLLVLRDGFTYAEAGEILGVPAGTVASRVATARVVLAHYLDGWRTGDD